MRRVVWGGVGVRGCGEEGWWRLCWCRVGVGAPEVAEAAECAVEEL